MPCHHYLVINNLVLYLLLITCIAQMIDAVFSRKLLLIMRRPATNGAQRLSETINCTSACVTW